ncbi:MAG: hypothetical protein AAFN30_08980 [Actinomycetota bacterium]
MGVNWTETLLRASFRRARELASEQPIWFAVLTAVPPLLIPAGVLGLQGRAAALVSFALVALVMFVAMIANTLLQMLYEVRRELGRHLDPGAQGVAGSNFDCELIKGDEDRVQVKVVNNDETGQFHAKIMEVKGEDRNGTWPITVRWLNDEQARERKISQGDSEVLTIARIRGRRAIDFLRPTTYEPAYQRVAAGADGGDSMTVRAHLVIFNERADAVARTERCLQLVFENGSDLPSRSELLPVDGMG